MTGPILWVVIATISLPFAFWGVQRFEGGGTDPVIARVGDAKITQSQFRNEYDGAYRQLAQQMGPAFDASKIDQAGMRDKVLQDMVDKLLLKQYARSAGYRIDDAGLREYLEAIPYFQDNGRFSADRYKSVLAGVLHTTPEQFEADRRDKLPVEQMREAVLASAFVTPAQTSASWRLERQQRVFSYVRFEQAKYLAAADVTDAQVKQRYDERKAGYFAPERIKLAYVELALEQMPKSAPPSDDVLRQIYDTRKASLFSSPEERHAAHILVAFGADKAAAQKKAQDLYAKLKAGADFAELARQNSDDPGSKAQGGDLGWVKRGTMVPKFEAALFAMDKPGSLGEPVETQFGWHIIKLIDVKAAQVKPFDDAAVHQQLVELWQQKDAVKNFQDQWGRLEQLAFENSASLDPAAKSLGLQIRTTDWITRKGGTDIASNPAVLAAAFSTEVQQDGDNSKPMALDPQHVVVVRKAAYEAPRQLALNEVSEQIRGDLKSEAAKARAKTEADALLKILQAGTGFESAVKGAAASAVSPGATARDNSALDAVLLGVLFRMPRPAAGKLGYAEAPLGNGDIAVIALSAVDDPVLQSADEAVIRKNNVQLRDAMAGAEFAAFRRQIGKRIAVQVKAKPAAEGAETGG
ncbi:MAG: SurA N-terminal domain-containing protein [Nevskia sp.]|nr:SurA N-terminal domain-containing protein [Nevskia sp.]